jgi:hypothetical protein
LPIEQAAIAVLGAAAAWLSQERRSSWRRWACIFGMLGQPFWLYATWKAGQLGMFVLSIVYAVAWMRGIWVNWISPSYVR